MTNYDKIASGLADHLTAKAKERQKAKAEITFNRSEDAYNTALKSKDGETIAKVVEALAKQRQEIYDKIFSTGGSDADIAEYNKLTAKLEKLQMHVNSLHEQGEI